MVVLDGTYNKSNKSPFFVKNPLIWNNNWSVLKLKISHWSCQNYQVFVQKVSLTAYLWTSLERAEHVNLKVLLCFYTLKASRSKKYYFFDVAAKKEDMVMINEWSREEVGYIWSCAKKDKNQKTHKYICWGINCRPPLLLHILKFGSPSPSVRPSVPFFVRRWWKILSVGNKQGFQFYLMVTAIARKDGPGLKQIPRAIVESRKPRMDW